MACSHDRSLLGGSHKTSVQLATETWKRRTSTGTIIWAALRLPIVFGPSTWVVFPRAPEELVLVLHWRALSLRQLGTRQSIRC